MGSVCLSWVDIVVLFGPQINKCTVPSNYDIVWNVVTSSTPMAWKEQNRKTLEEKESRRTRVQEQEEPCHQINTGLQDEIRKTTQCDT